MNYSVTSLKHLVLYLTAATNVVQAGLENNNYFISFEITNIVNFGTKFKNRVRIPNIRIYWVIKACSGWSKLFDGRLTLHQLLRSRIIWGNHDLDELERN
ncbi:hypothetical protein BpHYR1_043838, partial [Brachionus plicatilis]